MSRLMLALLLLTATFVVSAHSLSVAHLDVRTKPGEPNVQVELDIAVRDLALGLRLDEDGDDRVTWGELRRLRPQVERMVAEQVLFTRGGQACRLATAGFGIRRYDDGAYAALEMVAHCISQGEVRVGYHLFALRDPQHRALLTIRDGSATRTAIIAPDSPGRMLGASASSPFLDFMREGVHHILIGYDHLAFLMSLLLPAVLIRVGTRWRPAESIRSAAGHIAALVTAFTVAHSITLTAAAVGWITPASRWVEASIAASVVLAALNNLWPVVTRRIWVVGFGFGLVHGFGFAGALSELGLPADARVVSLLGFNLGVELGQLAVVAVVLPVLFMLRRHAAYARAVMPGLSVGVALLAGWWLFQRLAG